jgi:hypothetical protein
MLCKILAFFIRLLGCPRQARYRLAFTVGGIRITGDNLMARMNNEQTIEASINPTYTDGDGNQQPARIDGPASFSIDPVDAGTFEQLTDTSARFTPTAGFVGAAQVLIIVDADLDEDETRELTASGALEIITREQEATQVEVIFGEPVDQ